MLVPRVPGAAGRSWRLLRRDHCVGAAEGGRCRGRGGGGGAKPLHKRRPPASGMPPGMRRSPERPPHNSAHRQCSHSCLREVCVPTVVLWSAAPPPAPSPQPPGLLSTTQHHCRPPFLSDWAKFSSGPSAKQTLSLAPSVPMNLGQKVSSAPLNTQHHRRVQMVLHGH